MEVLAGIGFVVYVIFFFYLLGVSFDSSPSNQSTPEAFAKPLILPETPQGKDSEAAQIQLLIAANLEHTSPKPNNPKDTTNPQGLPEYPRDIQSQVPDLQPKIDIPNRSGRRHTRLSGKMIIFLWIVMIGGPVLAFFIDQNNRINLIPETIQDLGTVNHQAALSRLIELKGHAVMPLIGALNVENPSIRAGVVEALNKIKDKRAIEPLIAVLQDKDPTIRVRAVNALSQFEDKRTVMPLIALLKDENSTVREAAVDALAKTRDERMIEPLIAVLDDYYPTIRVKAAQVLVSMSDERAVEPLLKAMEKKDLPVIASQSSFFINRGKAGDEPIFIEALYVYGTSSTAADYLNSGNVELAQAAEMWAKANGYEITQARPGQSFSHWGGE